MAKLPDLYYPLLRTACGCERKLPEPIARPFPPDFKLPILRPVFAMTNMDTVVDCISEAREFRFTNRFLPTSFQNVWHALYEEYVP
jgi:hypothetical protein